MKIPEITLKYHAIAAEYVQICRQPIEGVFVSPSTKFANDWYGVIFVRRGPFGGGIFRFNVEIPAEFPNCVDLPKIVFEKSIFHPMIDEKSRVLDLSRSFPDGWKMEKHSLRRVLMVLQRSFYSFEVNSDKCVNPEAAILYKEHRNKFREISTENVEASRALVYDDSLNLDDPNAIRLLPWDASTHRPFREKLLEFGIQKNKIDSEIVGKNYPLSYSWFDPTEMTVITKYSEKVPEDTVSTARLDREKYGIEPLDLSDVSTD